MSALTNCVETVPSLSIDTILSKMYKSTIANSRAIENNNKNKKVSLFLFRKYINVYGCGA